MPSKRILVVGCGQIGLRLAKMLAKSHHVWGLKLTPDPQQNDIQFICADVTQTDTLNKNLPDHLDYIIYCLTPSDRNEESYRQVYLEGLKNLLSALPQKKPLARLYFISSSSVYGQTDQSWIDEDSPTNPGRFPGQVLLQAEAIAKSSIHPSTSIRFSGIYGANRTRLIRQVETGAAVLSTSCRLTNRIHEDDCVGFIYHLIQQDIKGNTNLPIYLASDSEPVEMNEVLEFIAKRLGVKLKRVESDNGTRRTENKKCNNKRMLESGYTLHFPSYQEGYTAMLNDLKT